MKGITGLGVKEATTNFKSEFSGFIGIAPYVGLPDGKKKESFLF